MPLLQEAQLKRELLSSSHDAIKQSEDVINSPLNQLTFPTLPNVSMFTPSQLLVASQTAALMAASGLGLQNPAFFHPGLFNAWTSSHAANSPPLFTTEKLSSLDQLSPALKTSKHHLSHHNNNNNNNNNVVSSSNMEDIKVKAPRRKLPKKNGGGGNEEELPISPPTSATSGSSPPSSADITTATNPSKDLSRDKQFTCGVCNRSFGYKHVLQNHERTHTGEKPFECPECHKRFTRDHHLKTHLRLHTGERPYHCEFCDRQFVQVANLRRHLRVHTGERPYACQYCTARFSDSNQLKAHVLIHKGEKPFECGQCNGKFRRRHHLLNHKCGNKEQQERLISSPIASDVSDETYHEDERKFNYGITTVEEMDTKILPTTYLDELKKQKKIKTEIKYNLEEKPSYIEDLQQKRKQQLVVDDIEITKQPAISYLEEIQKKRKPFKEARRVVRTSEPLISLPLRVTLPEQTEPEDLSMSTGLHSHSSGDSPLSRFLSTPEREEDDYELDDAASLYFQHQRTMMS